MRTIRNHGNVYKNKPSECLLMTKKEVSISLDEDILKKVDDSCQDNEFEIKRSTFINGILKEYFKNKDKNNRK